MMGYSLLRRWILMGIAEVLLALVLAAIAPIFINSNNPLLGFLIWLFIMVLLLGSVCYAIVQVFAAHRARHLFVRQFPHYRYLSTIDFLGLSPHQVAQGLETLNLIQTDPDYQDLHLSPFDFLRGLPK
jgi:threonine/homoserine/homoserine lactone efflux protein